jgi:glycosyltransferase
MLKISVITAVFNRNQTISQALDSVLSQTYPLVESILIDGASTDGTLDVLETYRSNLSKFISEPDKGV